MYQKLTPRQCKMKKCFRSVTKTLKLLCFLRRHIYVSCTNVLKYFVTVPFSSVQVSSINYILFMCTRFDISSQSYSLCYQQRQRNIFTHLTRSFESRELSLNITIAHVDFESAVHKANKYEMGLPTRESVCVGGGGVDGTGS